LWASRNKSTLIANPIRKETTMTNNHDHSHDDEKKSDPLTEEPEQDEQALDRDAETEDRGQVTVGAEPEAAAVPPETEAEEGEAVAPEPTPEQVAAEACEVARTMLSFFPKVKKPVIRWKVEDETIWVEIEGDPSGRLIGRRGQTIDAIQHVISKIVSHKFRRKLTVNVDAEKYRRRHREKLEKLARMTADYVAETHEPRALEPMSPADRRFIHIALRGRDDVLTASEGKEPSRFVVIWPNTDEE